MAAMSKQLILVQEELQDISSRLEVLETKDTSGNVTRPFLPVSITNNQDTRIKILEISFPFTLLKWTYLDLTCPIYWVGYLK